jgi:hypothetical protein
MTATHNIICLNGSAKTGGGSTSRMTAMLRHHFEALGLVFEERFLSQYHIRYCKCGPDGASSLADQHPTGRSALPERKPCEQRNASR